MLESILKQYPQADIYTLFYDPKIYGDYVSKHKIYTSILDTPLLRKYYQKLFPLYPMGIRSLKLQEEYDLIISSESGPAKGIKIQNKAPHVCYIHSPMRYAWSHPETYVQAAPSVVRPIMRFFLKRLKNWDKTTINNVDLYIANSSNVAKRVETYYNRTAEVVFPPIEESLFQKKFQKRTKECYLSFGAITPYKKIDLLVDAFNKNGKPLVIIGEGSEKEKLKKKAQKNIQFVSCATWKEVESYFLKSRALLFPGEEDFGMIPLEVMAYGIPVLAFGKGGALETVVENRKDIQKSSGLFFSEQTLDSLEKILVDFEAVEDQFDDDWIVNHAKKFREENFIKSFQKSVSNFLNQKNN